MKRQKTLRNKRILITAGPTWVRIDKVRVISNLATGETGILLAENFLSLGAKVTLLLGPVEAGCLDKRIRLIRFKFFEELEDLIQREISSKQYDIAIHSAAVSDYKPKVYSNHKIESDKSILKLNLVPTPKIINRIKRIDKSVFLVGFKFMPGTTRIRLINGAKRLIKQSKANLVIANRMEDKSYSAYLAGEDKVSQKITSKNELAKKLVKEIGEAICRN